MNLNKTQKSAVSIIEIGSAQHNQRLDNFLLKQLGDVPRTRVYRIIRKGEVRVNRKRCKPDYKLQPGDQVRIPPLFMNPERARKPAPLRLQQRLERAILYQNESLLVVDKPGGIAVHGGSGVDYGVIDAMRLLYPEQQIELVHRLDRDTSGCLLLAKNRAALLELQRQLKSGEMGKNYIAAVRGEWPRVLTEIDLALQKYSLPNGERRVRVDASGRRALTLVRPVRSGKFFSIIRLELVTGRTHQIRVHCQAQGHEIAGDEKYGDPGFNRLMRARGIRRLMLHASSLELARSRHCPEIVINAPLPDEFETLLAGAAEPDPNSG